MKRLTVEPGQRTSLQYHKFRSERWTIVEGEATVILGDDSHNLRVNDWIYIPIGEKHMLVNEKETVMQLIEVQVGDYLGEDDIFRLDDKYGRI